MIRKLLYVFLVAIAHNLVASAADDLQHRLVSAKAGQTITLPAGEFRGGVTIPAGVSLKGAGVGKTIIDATGIFHGLTIEGGSGAQISDLTIRGAQGTGVLVKNAEGTTLARVRVTGGSSGIAFQRVKKGRIENCISDHNNFGMAISASPDCVVVNCTVANCAEKGLSVAASPNAVVFNNCIVGGALCLNIDEPSSMRVDHNLYFGMILAVMQKQSSKKNLTAWQYLTGLDTHSVQMPVDFKNAAAGDFTPINVLSWALDRVVTADWGATELAGAKAPAMDMLGRARAGRPDIGALETEAKAPRTADGSFTVSNDTGPKSAGVFTKDGMLVSYLFHNLPLAKGKHLFWLPVRNCVGQPIPAGEYEVRLAESDFRWKLMNHVGDNGEDGVMTASASFNPKYVTFASNGMLIMQEGPSEDHSDVRAYDVATKKIKWSIHGTSNGQGVAAKDEYVYIIKPYNKDSSSLTRVNADTGAVIPWPGSNVGHAFPATGSDIKSLAYLEGHLYTTVATANKLYVLSATNGQVEKTLDVPAAQFVAADEKTKTLWVISGSSLVALAADGTKVAESTLVPDPLTVAACNGQLAVCSGKTGKIHFFDANDPKNLKAVREFGKGDGPYGAIEPERFSFQKLNGAPTGFQTWTEYTTSVALDATGRFAVVDYHRTSMFDKDGKNLWYTFGVFGNSSKPSHSTQNRRMWDTQGEVSFLMDERDGSWKPEAFWDHTLIAPAGLLDWKSQPPAALGDFSDGGKTFVVYVSGAPNRAQVIVARLDGFKAVPVWIAFSENGTIVGRGDSNGDGKIDAADTATPLMDAEGKPFPPVLIARFAYLLADGSIANMTMPAMLWKRTGLNAKGVPVYEGKSYVSMVAKEWKTDLSPYDFKPGYICDYGCNPFVIPGPLNDGGWVFQASLRGSGSTGLNNGAGTDLVGYTADGHRRWVNQLARYNGICGMGTADDITVTAIFYNLETIVVDSDGLGLGGFCEAPQLGYMGYWIDHPNIRAFKMPDGHVYFTNGDNSSGRHPWYRLENQQSLKKTKTPFQLAAARAAELAALEFKPAPPPSKPPQPTMRVAKLAQPLTIDGDLEKWRKAGVKPQIVIGPGSAMDGPGDCSAIIRVAYEGQNLYFQILQFDDVPTFHQKDLMFQQDAVELAINGTHPNGFQFICYKNPDGQDIVHRHRFFYPPQVPRKLAPEHAPRKVTVLPNAREVTEREALEGLYGTDLSKAKVIVTEFKLPLDKETYVEAEADVPELGPGKSFWLGFFIDDNDTPFTDVQELINWPATFGMFSPKEDGAVAVCE